jgi:phage terminase large subunit-like protein
LIDDRPDALWRRASLEAARVPAPPPLERIVVAIDPPVTSGPRADACGIVAAGRAGDGRAYVFADATVQGHAPLGWARAAAGLYDRVVADCIVAEVNQGGDMVTAVIRTVDAAVTVKAVRANRGKWLRAEPVAALYERGLVAHAGALPELEDQMCDFGPGGLLDGSSPDRLDALVWALTELMLTARAEPRIRAMF